MSTHQSPRNKSREMSDYEKFRLKRMKDGNDDDNLSAHFSNARSIMTDREEEIEIRANNIYRSIGTERENELVAKLTEK